MPSIAFGAENKFTNNLPKAKLPETSSPSLPSVDMSKYKEVLTGSTSIESVLPKIKERMGKFFDLMGQLKTEIDSQTFYSPVSTKTADFGNI